MMKDAQARTTYLKDYQPPAFLIDSTSLRFELGDDSTLVVARLQLRRNPALPGNDSDQLVLDGQELVLERVLLNNTALQAGQYRLSDDALIIDGLAALLNASPDQPFELECHTRLRPQDNTSLEGLYRSRTMYCTQCEAEGFRKITYYLDRPDVMSVFDTTIVADQARYPVLLSNGNAVDRGTLDDGRHWVSWQDPFPKPCYLFALVAGDLQHIEDRFVTASRRDVTLQLFVEAKDLDKCDHAMDSLKRSMRWDEEVYGREYDLDIFMIVAVDDFNMGAMENKGLNIFNTSCVLAKPETTTDAGFQRVEAVVAHEYFHNWSGNRVTCRDWFQLSLKEGFTVFRDAEFSADMGSRTVKRIGDATLMRTAQFAEDGGPMAHPVRPDAYMEISNFYTLTIYEKGAEVVRMIHQLLGPQAFRKGSDLYFERHDGQAVTTEDFVCAMEEASGVDLGQFRRWYSQAGTPRLEVSARHDPAAQQYHLRVQQHTPPTPGQAEKLALHIPLRMALLDDSGTALPLQLAGESAAEAPGERVLHVSEDDQTFVFEGISQSPVPSLLRSFSAPVRLKFDYSRDQLLFLMTRDSDGFNRWDASQQLAVQVLDELRQARSEGRALWLDEHLSRAFGDILATAIADAQADAELDRHMLALLLALPSEAYLAEQAEVIDVDGIHAVREFSADALAKAHQDAFRRLFSLCQSDEAYKPDAEGIARRALKNTCLMYLVRGADDAALTLSQQQFEQAGNMTDVSTALRLLVNSPSPAAEAMAAEALAQFYQRWQDEALVVDLWFNIQASSSRPGTLQRVRQLMSHEAFDIRNPNKVRALIGVFCNSNAVQFHDAAGAGYDFLAEQVIRLNTLNPQIAARLLTPLTRWRRYDADRQALMKAALQRIQGSEALSRDVYEVVSKSLH